MILGSKATVTGSPNHALVGLNGTVAEETRNMIVLETAGGTKMIPKKNTILQIGEGDIHGMDMRGRMHERLTGP